MARKYKTGIPGRMKRLGGDVVAVWEELIAFTADKSGFVDKGWVPRFSTIGYFDQFGATNRVGQFARSSFDKAPYDTGTVSESKVYIMDYNSAPGDPDFSWDGSVIEHYDPEHWRLKIWDRVFDIIMIDNPVETNHMLEIYCTGAKIDLVE